jgi:hypothetical protein
MVFHFNSGWARPENIAVFWALPIAKRARIKKDSFFIIRFLFLLIAVMIVKLHTALKYIFIFSLKL